MADTNKVAEGAAEKKQVVFVLGVPCCGKGTQCSLVKKRMEGWDTVSAGDVLRKERDTNKESETAKTIEAKVSKGEIVPSEITVGLMKKAMEESKFRKFLVDGFPRSQENIDVWNKVLGDFAEVVGVLAFDLEKEEAVKRALARQDSSRTDDGEAVVQKRLKQHDDEVEPLITKYAETEGFVARIDGKGRPGTVYSGVQRALRGFQRKMPAALRIQRSPRVPKSAVATFSNIGKIDANMDRVNCVGVVLDLTPIEKKAGFVDVSVGDKTGVVLVTMREDESLAVKGKVVKLQNVKVRMIRGFLRLSQDKWWSIKENESQELTESDVEKKQNVSTIEYEEVLSEGEPDTKEGAERTGRKGKGRKGLKGRKGGKKGEAGAVTGESSGSKSSSKSKGKGKGKGKGAKASSSSEGSNGKSGGAEDKDVSAGEGGKGGKRRRGGKGKGRKAKDDAPVAEAA